MRNSVLRSAVLLLVLSLIPLGLGACQRGPESAAGTRPAPPEPTIVPGIPPVPVALRWPKSGEQELSPADPLVLRFDEPLAAPSGAPALTLFPSVDGTESWNEAGDLLTFTPAVGFAAGQTYSAYLHPGLRGQQGQGLATQRLDFSILDSPQVLSHSPGTSELTHRLPTIRIRFDRPMDAASVAEALTVAPEIDLRLSWSDSNQLLTVIPLEPLPIGQRYLFTVGAAAADGRGVQLGEDYHWNYWLEGLQVQIRQPRPGHPDDPIELEFNYPVEQESLEAALRLSPNLSVDVSMQSPRLARLRPHPPLSPSTRYELAFTAPLRDLQSKNYPSLTPHQFISAPPILSYQPEGLEQPDAVRQIRVTFDRPMDQDSVEAAFSLEPAVPGDFTWQGNTMTYRLEEPLEYRQVYAATIDQRGRDAQGRSAFQVPFSWSFSHSYFEYSATFGEWGPKVQVVDAGGRRSLEYAVPGNSPQQVTFELHKLSTQQFAALARLSPRLNDPRLADVPGEAELIHRWEVTTLANREGGLEQLIIPEEVRPGLYLLRMRYEGRLADEIAIALSRYTLAVKRAGQQLLVWGTVINGEAVPDMEIRVFATDGRMVRQGLTDENGLYETALEPGDEPLMVFGRTAEGGSTVAGFTSAWRTYSSLESPWGFFRQGTTNRFMAYLYTERPIYRPGQTVYFKAIVREDHDAQYRLLPAGTEITLSVLDARDNLLETQTLMLNEFGSAHGQFTLGRGAGLGQYTLEAELEGETHQGAFQVQDYRKPDIAVEISSDEPGYVVGDQIPVQVSAEYFFGEPVPAAAVEVRTYELGEFYGYWWEGVPEDQEVQYAWYPSYGDPIRGRTDEAGQFGLRLPARLGAETGYWDSWWTGVRTTTWGIEVTVDDGSRQAVSDFVVVKVYSSAERVQLDAGGFFKQPGQSFRVQTAVEDLRGTPVAGRNLLLEVRDWDGSTYEYDRIIAAMTLKTGSDGSAEVSLDGLSSGFYELRLTNTEARGEDSVIRRWIYVYRAGSYWTRLETNSGALTLSADQAQYKPYETATIYVESPLEGPALLTVERAGIRREKVVELTPPITTVELPILAGDPPNIFVSVSAWQAQSTLIPAGYHWSNLPASRLLSATLELPVEAVGRELQIELHSDRPNYGPGEESEIRIRVTDSDGQPAAAEVSLALVDEAIYALSDDLAKPILEAFYGRRPNSVRTYSSLAPYREIYAPGRGGGGGEGPGTPGNPRSEFEDVAAWLPELRTNADGEVTARIRLPHNLTSWRVVARAVTRDTRVGEASLNFITRQDLVARPILPRILTNGDSLTLSALVHNLSERPQTIEVVIESQGLRIDGEPTQWVELDPGATGVVGWAAAVESEVEADITVTAQAGKLSDAVHLAVPVQQLAVPDVLSQVGSFTGEWSTGLVLPPDALAVSTVTLELDRSIAGTVLSGLEFLTGYPYGCVEQIMSAALPNAVVARAAARLGLSSPGLEADLADKVREGLQKLYAMQHSDGGWGWWYDDRSHDYQTAWVMFGLAVTRQAGYSVDGGSLQRGAAWLAENLQGMDPRTQAFALYSLALAGYPQEQASLDLAQRALGLDPFSQAALALALNEVGQTAEAGRLMEELEKSLVVVGDQAYWPSPHEDGHYYEKTMASSTRSTALALDALAKIDPQNTDIEPVVRWLVAHRRPFGWGTTNETSFSVLALTDYILAQEAAEGEVNYTVRLNGEEYANGALAEEGGRAEIIIPAADLLTGRNELELAQQGEGKLYYALTSRIIRPQAALDPAGIIGVSRDYFDAQSGLRIERAVAGQLVRVKLEVQLPVDGFYLLIEDKLPGGLEALNENLNSESHQVNQYDGQPIYYWEELGYNYKEVRSDRVSFFVTELAAGVYEYSYLARATHTGLFAALPAEVSAMYDFSLWGRSGSDVLTIVEKAGGELAGLRVGAQ